MYTRAMRRSLVLLLLSGAAACIEIPPNIHAEFAAAAPEDRSNFRPGRHGTALPLLAQGADDGGAPQAKAADVPRDADDAGDAGDVLAAADGGAP
jgi:hypothetical protein